MPVDSRTGNRGATIDERGSSAHERRVVRCEVKDGTGNFFWLRDTFKRMQIANKRLRLGRVVHVAIHLCVDGARENRIDTHTLCAVFSSERLSQTY